MQNNNYYHPGGQYAQFDPELQPGSMAPYGAQDNGMFAPVNGYGGPAQTGGQYYGQQGYPPQLPNMGGQQMQQYNGYANPQHGQQQFAPTYGPSHMATYANGGAGNRRSTMTIMPVMDIGMAPIAVKIFAERDEDGRPVPPMFMTEPNHDAGVVNIQHNPFNIRINEILVALGQESIVQDYPQSSGIYAIHIIQDRMTGKTNDIYVEFPDWAEAEKVMRRYNNQASRERAPKLGNRRAKMSLATSSALMKAIFPRAKCTWVNGKPERPQEWLIDNPCRWDGFITREELVKVLLFAEQPTSSKTRFAQDSPERVYQFMISSVQKIPWDADRSFFPKEWIIEFHAVLTRMAIRLANLVKDRQHVHLDSKLLEQFMKVMQCCPMYGNGDEKAMENYMSIAAKVDEIMSMAQNLAAPPSSRRRDTNASNGGYRPQPLAREDSNTLMEGLRGMHLVDRRSDSRDRSPVRRGQSPVRSHQGGRNESPVRQYRDESPVHQYRNESPVRQYRNASPVRQYRNESPVRQYRNESPVRQHQGHREESPVRQYQPRRHESPVRQYQARRDEEPTRRDQSPVRQEYSPVRRDRSPARRSEQYVSEYSSRASHRATASGSPLQSSGSGRRSTLQFSAGGSSSGRSNGRSRHYDD